MPNLFHMRIVLVAALGFGLAACEEEKAASVGFWKASDRKYVEITESENVYSATVYRNSSFDGTLEKNEFAATYSDGTLSIALPSGPLAVLYKADEDVIVIGGDEVYSRVDAAATKAELTARLEQVQADASLCESLQQQIDRARQQNSLSDNAVCKAFMDPITSQKPKNCRLLYTSCNSF